MNSALLVYRCLILTANHQKSPAGIEAIRRRRPVSCGSPVANPSNNPTDPPMAVKRIRNVVHSSVFRLTKKISAIIGTRQTHKTIPGGWSLSQSSRRLIASGMRIMSIRPILNCNTRKSEIVRGQKCLNDSVKGSCSGVRFEMIEADKEKVDRVPWFKFTSIYSDQRLVCPTIC